MAEQNERQLDIQIDITPAGLHVTARYAGGLSTIPAAIERLKALGVIDLVAASAPAPATPATKDEGRTPKAERVAPSYNADGDPCCPVHKRKLQDGAHGLFCSAKAKAGQVADKNGYCGLKFEE